MADLQPVAVLAKIFDCTERQVYDLVRAGTIPRAQRGRYDVLACTRAYIRHLREVAAGRQAQAGGVDLAGERARLAKEQADAQAMKNAQSRQELMPSADSEAIHVALHSAVQRRMLAVPTHVAPLVAVENEARVCEAILRDHIAEALEELADAEIVPEDSGAPAEPDEQRPRGRRRAARVPPAAEADGERVGGRGAAPLP